MPGHPRRQHEASSKVSLFHKLLLCVLLAGAVVLTYDLFQVEMGRQVPRIRFDPATGRFTFRRPEVDVRIVYASMFGPGEPVMRVRDRWIYRFEEEYSDRLAEQRGWHISDADAEAFVREAIRRIAGILPQARARLERIQRQKEPGKRDQQIEDLASWLGSYEVFITPPAPRAGAEEKFRGLKKMVEGLQALADGAPWRQRVRVRPRLVTVERRWQGRWVLSANRPRFLTGREVPDVITGSKMELLALVQDGYAVPLNVPLPGEKVAPLDTPDTWGDPSRRWRDAFIPAMLEEGKYDFLDPDGRKGIKGKIYLPPLTCSTNIIFYNEVLFKKAGIDRPPKTWPEFIAVCEKLKAAGITPLTADADVYCDMWQTWLTIRVLGPEAWERTISGWPPDVPIQQRRPEPPWTSEGYRKVYAAIRQIRSGGYFDKDFRGSTWPAAQRSFAKGSAAMMICGSWLVQELSGYKDRGTSEQFRLRCFSFPAWPGGRQIDQKAVMVSPYGLMICRQGGATRGAIELVKYLSARDHPDMVYQNAQISCVKDAAFPPALAGIEKDIKTAPVVYSRLPTIYARRFATQVLGPLYRKFFRVEEGEPGFMTVDEFLAELQEENIRYLRNGGEEGYE